MYNFKKILAIAPHTDDVELGCGGSIARFVEEGKEVYLVSFSAAEKSVKPEFPKDILRKEIRESTKILGILPKNLILLDYPVRVFPEHRQEILEELVKFRDEIKPDIVFVPSLNDIHQDHRTIANEVLRAFRHETILGYEQPWNNIVFKTECFIPLKKHHLEKKIKALNCYNSQKYRPYLTEEMMISLAKVRGVQIRTDYAEAFEVLRFTIK